MCTVLNTIFLPWAMPCHTTWSPGFCCVEPCGQSFHCPYGGERLRLCKKLLSTLWYILHVDARPISLQSAEKVITAHLAGNSNVTEVSMGATWSSTKKTSTGNSDVHGDSLHHVYWHKISLKTISNKRALHFDDELHDEVNQPSLLLREKKVHTCPRRNSVDCHFLVH